MLLDEVLLFLGMAPSEASLGVTALLDELLLEGQLLDEQEAQIQQQQQNEPKLSAEDQQQLAELHEEVDGCLASMENWGEESRARRAKLMQELEAEFGFSCDVESTSGFHPPGRGEIENGDSEDFNATQDDDEDMSRYLGGANRRQHQHSEPHGPLMSAHLPATATSTAKAICRDQTRHADAERIQKLRDEVEAMRQQEAFGLGPYNAMEPDDLDATGGVAAGMSAWCQEVDAVLEDPSLSADSGGLNHAIEGLNEMDTGLNAAQSRLGNDILEMERLLAECSAQIQAQKEASAN